jgi:hypothetical protein
MPITVTVTQHVFTTENEKKVVPALAAIMMKLHGLTDNKFMTPVVIGSINIVAPEHIFSGGVPVTALFIEWKVPSFAFGTQEIRDGYVKEATDVAVALSNGKLTKKNVFVNVVHALDGIWGVNGKAYTNAELGAAVQANIPY